MSTDVVNGDVDEGYGRVADAFRHNLPTSTFVFAFTGGAFGWPGLGGSFGFADPDTGIGFGYAMNKLGYHPFSDPCELALRQAFFRDVLGRRTQR